MEQIRKFVMQKEYSNIKFTTSSPTLLEVIPSQSGKGGKINDLRRLYPQRTLIGVGDYDNDIDLLTNVDIAACPENANERIKQLSSIHLCHHDKGCIADLIYHLDSIKSK